MLNQITSKLLTLNKHSCCCVLFCICRKLINFKLYNLSAQLYTTIFWRALSQIQANQSNLLTFKNQPINNVEWSTCGRNDKNKKQFYESKKLLGSSMQRETCQSEKKGENGENIFFKALANRFRMCRRTTRFLMDGLLSNGLHEKVMIYMLLKVDQMHSLLRKSPWQ